MACHASAIRSTTRLDRPCQNSIGVAFRVVFPDTERTNAPRGCVRSVDIILLVKSKARYIPTDGDDARQASSRRARRFSAYRLEMRMTTFPCRTSENGERDPVGRIECAGGTACRRIRRVLLRSPSGWKSSWRTYAADPIHPSGGDGVGPRRVRYCVTGSAPVRGMAPGPDSPTPAPRWDPPR